MKHIGRYKFYNAIKDTYKGESCENCKIKYKCTDAKKSIVNIDIRTKYRKQMWKKIKKVLRFKKSALMI